MNRHPTAAIDDEDRRLGRREGFWRGLMIGIALSIGSGSGLIFWGVI